MRLPENGSTQNRQTEAILFIGYATALIRLCPIHHPHRIQPVCISMNSEARIRWSLYLYRQRAASPAELHDGKDKRVKPYGLFRTKIDGTPVQYDNRRGMPQDPVSGDCAKEDT